MTRIDAAEAIRFAIPLFYIVNVITATLPRCIVTDVQHELNREPGATVTIVTNDNCTKHSHCSMLGRFLSFPNWNAVDGSSESPLSNLPESENQLIQGDIISCFPEQPIQLGFSLPFATPAIFFTKGYLFFQLLSPRGTREPLCHEA